MPFKKEQSGGWGMPLKKEQSGGWPMLKKDQSGGWGNNNESDIPNHKNNTIN